jgi:hypothetical protein
VFEGVFELVLELVDFDEFGEAFVEEVGYVVQEEVDELDEAGGVGSERGSMHGLVKV